MLPEIEGILIQNGQWNSFAFERVLQYYDGPRLTGLQRSPAGQLFLAWWSDSDGSTERWVFLPLSEPRLHEILSGHVSSLEGLNNPEDGYLLVADIDSVSGAVVRTTMTSAAALPSDSLPLKGARLNIPVPEGISEFCTRERTHTQDSRRVGTGILPIANEPTTGSMREHLVGALARVVPEDIRIATAYLTPDGFLDLKDGMEGAASVRLLLGERPFMNRRGPGDVLSQPGDNDELQGPAESVDWFTFLEGGYPWLLLTHEERRELLARGATPEVGALDLSAWERVTALADFLRRDCVVVRRFLGSETGKVLPEKVLDHRSPRNRLHAKAYLFSGEMVRYAAVGSSNLTKSGLSENSELNLASYDWELTANLEGWFDEKWELGQDCKAQFIQRLEECVLFGRRYTPWQVMLKSLHAAYGRFLEMGLSEEVIGRLAGFQQQAVQRCVALLRRHWGAMLCDSVGLGKTYEGLGILREFANQRSDEPPTGEGVYEGANSVPRPSFRTTGAPTGFPSGESSPPRSPWSRCPASRTLRRSRHPFSGNGSAPS